MGESEQRGKVGCSRENSLESEERSEQRELPWGTPHVLRDPQCKTVLSEKPQETGPRPGSQHSRGKLALVHTVQNSKGSTGGKWQTELQGWPPASKLCCSSRFLCYY